MLVASHAWPFKNGEWRFGLGLTGYSTIVSPSGVFKIGNGGASYNCQLAFWAAL